MNRQCLRERQTHEKKTVQQMLYLFITELRKLYLLDYDCYIGLYCARRVRWTQTVMLDFLFIKLYLFS